MFVRFFFLGVGIGRMARGWLDAGRNLGCACYVMLE